MNHVIGSKSSRRKHVQATHSTSMLAQSPFWAGFWQNRPLIPLRSATSSKMHIVCHSPRPSSSGFLVARSFRAAAKHHIHSRAWLRSTKGLKHSQKENNWAKGFRANTSQGQRKYCNELYLRVKFTLISWGEFIKYKWLTSTPLISKILSENKLLKYWNENKAKTRMKLHQINLTKETQRRQRGIDRNKMNRECVTMSG